MTDQEKQVDIEAVELAVKEVAQENAELKAAQVEADAVAEKQVADLEAKSVELKAKEEELASKAALIEELEAKASAPAIHIKKEEGKMDQESHVKTFMVEGLEGLRAKAADLQISTDAQGGYALPEELRREIIRLEHEVSPLRQEVSVTTASTTDVKQLVSIGGAASGWVGETDTRAQTDSPELAQRTAVFGEVYARPRVFQHALEDAFFDAESWLAGEVARQFAEAEGVAFLNGDGTNKPVGILNGVDASSASAANDTTGAFEVINFGDDGALGSSSTDIIDNMRSVVLSCKTGYLTGAKFMMNRATHNVLAGLKDANGQYFINRDIANAAGSRIFGFDIVINDDMADIPSSTGSAAPVLFGNFKRAFQIIDLVGVSMLRDPYSNHGSVLFYTRKRCGSMILDASALKVIGVSKS